MDIHQRKHHIPQIFRSFTPISWVDKINSRKKYHSNNSYWKSLDYVTNVVVHDVLFQRTHNSEAKTFRIWRESTETDEKYRAMKYLWRVLIHRQYYVCLEERVQHSLWKINEQLTKTCLLLTILCDLLQSRYRNPVLHVYTAKDATNMLINGNRIKRQHKTSSIQRQFEHAIRLHRSDLVRVNRASVAKIGNIPRPSASLPEMHVSTGVGTTIRFSWQRNKSCNIVDGFYDRCWSWPRLWADISYWPLGLTFGS